MKNSEYWKLRAEQAEKEMHEKSEKKEKEIVEIYEKAKIEIDNKINIWYKRIAKNNSISFQDAKKLLNKNELKEFRWSLEEYIEKGKQNSINSKWIKQLENASAKHHINKLESIKIQLQAIAEETTQKIHKEIKDHVSDVFEEGCYKTAYDINVGTGICTGFEKIDKKMLEEVIYKPWTLDGINFSSRIWSNKEKLIAEMHRQLSIMMINGKPVPEISKEISEKMNVPMSRAKNAVYTEAAYFYERGRKQAFDGLGVEKYRIVATWDIKTSDICQEMDGQEFYMNEYEVGVTAPPFHNYCRTTIAPTIDKTLLIGRAARDENGKTIIVNANMTYKEWKNKYVA